MVRHVEVDVDVTHAVGMDELARVVATVILPDPSDMPERPIICFAKPGGGYSRGYYSADLPGEGPGSQGQWHAERGWIFVALDMIGTGSSSRHAPEKLNFQTVVGAMQTAEQDILLRLANGMIAPDFPPVHQPVCIGIGQSMGGGLTIVQQGRHHCYDGVAALGYSAVHSHPPSPPGAAPIVVPWIPRDCIAPQPTVIINRATVEQATGTASPDDAWHALAWGFFYDDVAPDVVQANLAHFDHMMFGGDGGVSPTKGNAVWQTTETLVQVTQTSMTPGAVASEAAAITVPVLCAMGERDIVPDPKGEPRAFHSASSVDIFICPRMGHMHNFASSRLLLWQRIEGFGQWCALVKAAAQKAPSPRNNVI